MGKIVRGARVAQNTYVLKPPVILPAAVPISEEAWHQPQALAFEPEQPPIDLEAMRAQADELIERASNDAKALLHDAEERGNALVLAAEARVSQIEEAARNGGFEQGRADGLAAAQAEMDEMLETMRGLIEMARVERHKIVEGAEPEIVRLATAIAERILHKHVEVDAETALSMTRSAITRLVNRETVTVRVNPADLETMRENRERLMTLNDIEHLRIIEDQRVDRGGVVIETDAGTIDSKISTQLREVRRVLAVDEPLEVIPSPAGELLHPAAQAS